MAKYIISVLVFVFISFSLFAQTNPKLTGAIHDSMDNSPLIGATVVITNTENTNLKQGAVTDLEGNFIIQNIVPGTYIFRASSVGFKQKELRLTIGQQDQNLGRLKMAPVSLDLKEVKVQGRMIRAQQKGDTTQYNADAFKVNPDANAQDLITKMPGVTMEGGQVKAQGEDVKQVLVDGKPFFGEDPNVALKNLPAEIIDKVEVFDRMSDQSQFTGFNDGNTSKTINIITKKGKNNGQFGKISAGYGTDNRYIASGNLNLFNGNRRISILGLSNNINQQNFSIDDIVGAMGGSGAPGRGGRGAMRGGGRPGGGRPGGMMGNSGVGDFLVGQPGGITTTNAFGLNFSDSIGKKLYLSGSYFFNHSNTENNSALSRNYFTSEEENTFYSEDNLSQSRNMNNRLNLRLEYNIDSFNSLIYTPRISFQDNTMGSLLTGQNRISENRLLSETQNSFESENFGYNISNSLLFRHRFSKQGRTLSLNLSNDINNRDGESLLLSSNRYYNDKDSSVMLNQEASTFTKGTTYSSNITYTEPLSKNSMLQFSYNPSLRNSQSDRQTYNYDLTRQEFLDLDTTLSNKFDNKIFTNKGGASYRLKGESFDFSAGADYQNTLLEGMQLYPNEFTVSRTFNNILPNARFNYKLSQSSNLRVFYRSSTNLPSVNQLQNVVDNSNPLLLTTGNPQLSQSFTNTFVSHYSKTNAEKGRNFFVFLFASNASDYISNSTTVAQRDSVLPTGNVLYRGSQLSRPVNLDGYYTTRTFFTYGFLIDKIKSNLNLNGGVSYSHTPGLINNELNFSNNLNFSPGFTLSSNVSQNLDFTLSYSANYNIVENTLRKQLNNNFFFQTTSFRFNWIFWKGFVFNTDLNHTLYSGLESGFNQDFLLWNMSIGKKFLKDNRGELRISAFDLLKQNNSIGRNVTETYVEDTRTQVLQQYFMLTFTYNLRNFKGGAGAGAGSSQDGQPGSGRQRQK